MLYSAEINTISNSYEKHYCILCAYIPTYIDVIITYKENLNIIRD